MSTVYIGNLSYSTTEDKLKEFVAEVAPVKSTRIPKKSNNESKGYGFVELEKEDDVEKVISELHEKDLDDRKVTVERAGKKPPRRSTYRSPPRHREYRRRDDSPRYRDDSPGYRRSPPRRSRDFSPPRRYRDSPSHDRYRDDSPRRRTPPRHYRDSPPRSRRSRDDSP